MKIIKPLTLGILNRPYCYREQNWLALTAIGFFRLGKTGQADRFMTENLQWAKVVPVLPPGLPLDHVLPKARAEVMLSGTAYAIDDPVKAMEVRMQCGSVDKHLCVVGDRHWRRLFGPWLCIDEAKTFSRMPITWENAWGGEGYQANLRGRGYLPPFSWLYNHSGTLPNLELAETKLMPGRHHHKTACLAPMNLSQALLQNNAGTYDKRWLEKEFPGLPRDIDFGLFNMSAADQQFVGHFNGDEAYCLTGVHPQLANLSGTLPGFSSRAFILRDQQQANQLEEIELRCDTVWFMPDLDLGVLIYRGQTSIVDSDALDISTIMIAYERLNDKPRTLDHYREVMTLRLDPETAGLHAFNESQLAPPRREEEIKARAERRKQLAKERLIQHQQRLDEEMQVFWQKSGLDKPTDYLPPAVAPLLMPEIGAEGDFDLAEWYAQTKQVLENSKRDSEKKLAAGLDALDKKQAEKFPDLDAKKQTLVADELRKVIQRANIVAHDLVTEPALCPDPLPEKLCEALTKAPQAEKKSNADCVKHPKIAPLTDSQLAEIRESAKQLPSLQRMARNAALTPSTLQETMPEPIAAALGEQVRQWIRDGVTLAGRDLAGANLRNIDLRGADLREVMFERADLRGAQFTGANLQRAVLTTACLDNADFSKACLDGANLCGSRARSTRFVQASLCEARALNAVWPMADLCGAQFDNFVATDIDLSGAKLDNTQLLRSVLTGCKAGHSSWRNTSWHRVIASAGDFVRADFSGATLERCVLMDAVLSTSNWAEANLSNVYAGGKADWQKSCLRRAHIRRCGFHGARLNYADMREGVFTQSDFGEADLSDARMQETRFYRSLLMRSRLHRVQAQRADFFQALCRKADFSDALMDDCVLTQADTSEVIWQTETDADSTKKAPLMMGDTA